MQHELEHAQLEVDAVTIADGSRARNKGPLQHSTDAEDAQGYYTHTRPEVLRLVPESARTVLDVGCGAGGFSSTLKARQNVEVHGVELSPEAAATAERTLDRVWNATIEAALPDLQDAYYDCIVIADVLEHLVDPWAVLGALKAKLAPDGRLVASIPNIQNWGVLSEVLQGRWDYQAEGILDRTHLRFFTRKSVEELFWTAGLRIESLTTTVRGPAPPKALLKGLARSGLADDSLKADGQTFQYLVEATLPKPAGTPRVCIVILNWNGRDDTLECLESIRKLDYPNYQVVVVDNGSSDDSVDAISQQFPEVELLQTGKNLGYAGGNNVGIRWGLEHHFDFILVLNNDTIVDHRLISAFISQVEQLPHKTILSAKIRFYDRPEKLWFAGGQWEEHTSSFKHIGFGQEDGPEFDRVARIDYASGCALFAAANVFSSVGLFDESFFLTYEETDWCFRARRINALCALAPNALVYHKVSASFGGSKSPLYAYFIHRNKLLWARKNLSMRKRWRLHLEALDTIKSILWPASRSKNKAAPNYKKAYWFVSSLSRNLKRNLQDPVMIATLTGIRDFYFGRFGDCPERVRRQRS